MIVAPGEPGAAATASSPPNDIPSVSTREKATDSQQLQARFRQTGVSNNHQHGDFVLAFTTLVMHTWSQRSD